MRVYQPITFFRSMLICSLAIGTVFWACAPGVMGQNVTGFNDPLGGLKLPGQQDDSAPVIKVTKTLEPKTAKPGDTVTLALKIEMSEGSYTYSMNPAFSGGTRVELTEESGLKATSEFTSDHPPKVQYVKEFQQNLEKFTKAVTWTRTYQIEPGATSARIKGTLKYQVCDASTCRNFKEPIDFSVDIAGSKTEPASIPRRETDSKSPEVTDGRFQIAPQLKHKNAEVVVRLTPRDAKPGDIVSLQFQVKLQKDWHVFSTTQPEEQAASATEFSIKTHDGLEPVDTDFIADRDFKVHHPVIGEGATAQTLTQEIYEDEVTWTRKFKLLPDKQLADVKVVGEVLFQTCADRCIQNRVKFVLPTPGTNEVAAGPSRGSPEPPTARGNPEVSPPVPAKGTPTGPSAVKSQVVDVTDGECVSSTAESDPRSQGLLYVLGAAFVAGWLALLTPCVFPMVPITVSFFLKQSEKKHSSPLKLALVYCLSIIGTFTVLGLLVSGIFGATSITKLANGVGVNLFLGIVLLFFSLNLLGLFDIQIPSWLLTFTASKESTSSYFGVFFMALTFTLTSFTCTFAFLGLILVWAANGDFWWPLAGLLSFSTAFALPFFLLALFPSYLQKLPKSGGWMNRVKVIMGLIEMAFMFKFLSVADIAWNSSPTLLDYHFVMSAWMAISVVAGLYLLGKIQLPHDTKADHIGVVQLVVAMGFIGLAGYLGVGIFGHESLGGFWGQKILAFAPPRLEGGTGEDGPYLIGKHDKKKYLLDLEFAKAKAQRDKVPLFIDFTGENCLNCREMELLMSGSALTANLDRFVRVQLYCDKVPKEAVGDLKQREEMVERNSALQSEWIKDVALPGYVVVSPDGAVIYSRIRGKVAESDFATFLDCGYNKWTRAGKAPEVAAATKP